MGKTTSIFSTWSVFQDEKIKFDKASKQYYTALEKHLAKKNPVLSEVRREVGAEGKEEGKLEEGGDKGYVRRGGDKKSLSNGTALHDFIEGT